MMINRFGLWFKPRAIIGVDQFQVYANNQGDYITFKLHFNGDIHLNGSLVAEPDEIIRVGQKTAICVGAGNREGAHIDVNGYGTNITSRPGWYKIVDRFNEELAAVFEPFDI